MVEDLLKISPTDGPSKNQFFATIHEYEEMYPLLT